MFLRWEMADLVTDLICDWKESVESRMTLGLWTSVILKWLMQYLY